MNFQFLKVSGAQFRVNYRLNSDILPISITLDTFADRVMRVHLLSHQPYEVTKRFFLDILQDILLDSSSNYDIKNIDFTKSQSQICIGNKVVEFNFDAQTITLNINASDKNRATLFWEIITTLKDLDSI